MRIPDADLDEVLEPGVAEVGPGDLGVPRLELEGDERPPAGSARASAASSAGSAPNSSST